MSTQTLNETEQTLLESCERDIAENLTSWRKLGAALNEVRESRLYRLTHDTFEDYCEVKWGISRSHGNGLADAARVLRELPPHLSAVVDNERQARELVKLSEEEREEVLNIVVQSGQPVTSARISETAKSLTSTGTQPAPKRISSERLESIVAKETEKFLALLDDFPDHGEPIEEALRFLFETAEERYIARHPEHAPLLAGSLRKMLAQIESGVGK